MKDKNFGPLEKFISEIDVELTDSHKLNLNVSEKNGFYIYNYNNTHFVPRDDKILSYCRGLVLREDGSVASYPFKRFFNFHEKECDDIDWDSAEILEKLDGSLLSIWHTGSEWEVTTRGSFYPVESSFNFKEQFIKLFTSFDRLIEGRTYMFELISDGNRIVTKYDTERVVLIGARSLYTFEESSQNELDEIAIILGVDRPRRYSASSVDECRTLFENMKDDEEGLVIVDKNFNRMKLKQESYLKLSRIVNMKDQDILDFVLGNSDIDYEFDVKEVSDRIGKVKKMVDDVVKYAYMVYTNLEHIKDKKEFASYAVKYNISSLLFSIRAGKTIRSLNIRYNKYLLYYNSIVSPTRKKLIVLRGVPCSGKSTWVTENSLSIYTLSMDSIRIMLQSPDPYISQKNNKLVWNIFMNMLEIRMSNGSFTVLDNMHINDSSMDKYKELCNKYGYEIEEKLFTIKTKDALYRNNLREIYKRVPNYVIEDNNLKLIETFINRK